MNKLMIGLLTLLMVFGCKKEEPTVDPEIQIAEYIAEKGLNLTTTASGLRYEFQEEGEGDLPISNAILSLTFTEKLADGTINSQRNSPTEAYITTQTPGLEEGLRLMRKGSKGTIIVPPELAYGDRAVGSIPANSYLIYEVEIFDMSNRIQDAIDEYIAANNLTVTENAKGLFYILNEPGGSDKPNIDSTIDINYVGRLTDGDIFDQSGADPATFPLSNLIRGWQIGIPLMGRGGAGTFIIPPQLGYGFEGRPGIPSNAVLIFDIELLDF